MKCKGKEILPVNSQDCPNDANGMFNTIKGILPLCLAHSVWAKQNRMIVNKKDNYFG